MFSTLCLAFIAAVDAADAGVTNSLGMKLARIEPGAFLMGQGEAPPASRAEWLARDADESPAHRVRISKAFHIGVHEVSNAQYERFDPTHKKRRPPGAGDDHPVVFVTWDEAAAFCAWLSKKEGKAYRLPTEAEWEYTCRAGTTTTFSTGDSIDAKRANLGLSTDGKKIGAQPVGSYPPNPWGLCDMHGNVAEWCLDWYGPYEKGDAVDPVGRVDGHARVTRGWSHLIPSGHKDGARYARSSNRSGHLPEDANRYTGFRVVLGDMPATKPLPVAPPPRHQRDVKQTPAPKSGPDPKTPFFVNFAAEKKNPILPANTWGPLFSAHNHFAACCVCPNGDVLAAWYSTVQESGRECAIAGSRLRAGSDRWNDVDLFFTVPDVNCHAPVLFSDGKRLYHFCTQSLRGWDDASNIMRTSDDNGATWSKPRIILPRDSAQPLSQPCSALLTSGGFLVLACDGDLHRDERILLSKDGGKTWTVGGDMRKACGGKYVIHPAIFEKKDGRLAAFLRGPNPMPLVVSKDVGASWETEETMFPGISSGQKATTLRLASGGLLLCSFDNPRKLVGGGTFAALSEDDGKTWRHIRKIEGAGGYMQLAQAPSGVIYLFGSRMGVVAFNEAWLRAPIEK
ncbi:MAG: SUMF1/EgtB/PvdO family nonheme iron enzyme [Gemmataceae bacterium]